MLVRLEQYHAILDKGSHHFHKLYEIMTFSLPHPPEAGSLNFWPT